MTLPTFAPSKAPDFPIDFDDAPKVLNQEYGDGIVGRIDDGLNTDMLSLDLSWTNVSQAEADNIYGQFRGWKGSAAFLYQPPDPYFSSPMVWISQKFRRSRVSANTYTVTATLQQVPDVSA